MGEYRGSLVNSIFHLKYCVSKKILIVFHSGSNYDYHFIIKELTEKFKKQFTYLGESNQTYITFTVPLEKEVDQNVSGKTRIEKR